MFSGRIFIDGNIVLNFLVEEGICTEDAECNLRGDIEISVSKLRKTETGNELKYESIQCRP